MKKIALATTLLMGLSLTTVFAAPPVDEEVNTSDKRVTHSTNKEKKSESEATISNTDLKQGEFLARATYRQVTPKIKGTLTRSITDSDGNIAYQHGVQLYYRESGSWTSVST